MRRYGSRIRPACATHSKADRSQARCDERASAPRLPRARCVRTKPQPLHRRAAIFRACVRRRLEAEDRARCGDRCERARSSCWSDERDLNTPRSRRARRNVQRAPGAIDELGDSSDVGARIFGEPQCFVCSFRQERQSRASRCKLLEQKRFELVWRDICNLLARAPRAPCRQGATHHRPPRRVDPFGQEERCSAE